jgi:hypothetical protein
MNERATSRAFGAHDVWLACHAKSRDMRVQFILVLVACTRPAWWSDSFIAHATSCRDPLPEASSGDLF